MIPKKHHDVIKQTAEELQMDEGFVKAFIDWYYQAVRKELSTIKKTRIELRGIGYFDLKFYKVKYVLANTRSYLMYHNKKTGPRAFTIAENLKRKLVILEQANELAIARAYKRADVRAKRKEYVLKHHGRLEATPKDLGGNVEHTVSEPVHKEDSDYPW